MTSNLSDEDLRSIQSTQSSSAPIQSLLSQWKDLLLETGKCVIGRKFVLFYSLLLSISNEVGVYGALKIL